MQENKILGENDIENVSDQCIIIENIEPIKITDIDVITHKEALKIYAKNSASFCLSRFVGVASDFVAAYMVSRLGNKYLAASGLITVTNNFVIQSSFVSNYATGILQGNFIRSNDINDKPNVGRMLMTSYIYSLGISLADSILLSFSGNIFRALGQDADITSIVNDYFRAFAMTGGVAFTLFSVSSQQTAYALDKRNLVLAVNILRRAVYLGFAYAMIFGEYGFPELGIAGLAYARTISAAADQIFFTLYYRFNKNLAQYEFFKNNVKESFQFMRSFLKTAALMGGQTFNEFAASFVGMNFIGLMGENQLAAAEIAIQYDTLVKIPILSAMQTTSIEMKKLNSALSRRRLGNIAILTTMLIPLISIPVLCAAREDLISLFMKNESPENQAKIITLASYLIIMVAFNQIFEVIRSLSAGALRGNGRFEPSLIASVLTMSVIGMPLAYALGISADLGAIGVFLSTMIGSAIGSSLLLPYWLRTSHLDTLPAIIETTPLLTNQDEENIQSINVINHDAVFQESKVTESISGSRFSFWSKPENQAGQSDQSHRSICTIL
jgi:MATE family multidrug resistance protein